MEFRLGQLLVEQGVLDEDQVQNVLLQQQETGEPFGVLCERMFDVSPDAIENAWAMQYSKLTRHVDPATEVFDRHALELLTRRQAWQFRILPIRFDGNELLIATTQEHLRRALRFAVNVIGIPVFFVITEPDMLGEALCRYYELPGMTPDSVLNNSMGRILRRRAACTIHAGRA